MLNIRKSLELVRILNPFITDPASGEDIFDFTGKIIHSIRVSDTPEVFADALLLMYDYSLGELSKMSGADTVKKFTDGLKENKILSLCEFYQWLMT